METLLTTPAGSSTDIRYCTYSGSGVESGMPASSVREDSIASIIRNNILVVDVVRDAEEPDQEADRQSEKPITH